MKLTFDQIRSVALQAGFPVTSVDVAAAIAMAESTQGDPRALGDNGSSFGLWQINITWNPQFTAAAQSGALYDPLTNAQAALVISRGGTYWHPWSTFNEGLYLKYLPASSSTGVGASDLLAVLAGVAFAMALETRALRPLKARMMRARRALGRTLRL